MTHDELTHAFERGTLDPALFRHREHLRVAWTLLARHGRREAERRMLDGITALAARAGRPEKVDPALTRAWMAALEDAARSADRGATFDDVLAAHPRLLDRHAVQAARTGG
jgi:hypothetical protein